MKKKKNKQAMAQQIGMPSKLLSAQHLAVNESMDSTATDAIAQHDLNAPPDDPLTARQLLALRKDASEPAPKGKLPSHDELASKIVKNPKVKDETVDNLPLESFEPRFLLAQEQPGHQVRSDVNSSAERDRSLTSSEPDFSQGLDLSDYLLAFTRVEVDYDERSHIAAAQALKSQKITINADKKRIHKLNQIVFWLQENRPEVWVDIQKFTTFDKFSSITKKWNLSVEESNALLGPETEQSARIRHLTSIYKALNIIYGDGLANTWIKMPNRNSLFCGQAPLGFMIAGGMDAILGLKKLLDSRLVGN